MGRKLSRGVLVIMVGILLVFVLTGCVGGEKEAGEEEVLVPINPEEADNVLVRVSGALGTAYTGSYGTLGGEPQIVEATLGDEPQEYVVVIEEGRTDGDGIIASFRKTETGPGELEAAIVADGVVIAESMTRVPNGTVNVDWMPQSSFQEEDEIVSEEGGPEE